jgi:NAD(P)-dependent dehydrogenase (short-subunit alcohol dehydrogenase family)
MAFLDDIFSLDGKTAIVAGGAGVIGTVMSAALLHAGANVVIWSRTQESMDQALKRISLSDKFVDRIAGYRVDTGSEAEVAEGLKDAVSKFGSLQILINAVGGGRGKAPLVETDMAQFETVLKLNLTAGLMIPTKAVAAYWIAAIHPLYSGK